MHACQHAYDEMSFQAERSGQLWHAHAARQQLDSSSKGIVDLQQQKTALQVELDATSASLCSVTLEREQAAALQAELQEQVTSQAAEIAKLHNSQETLEVSLATTNSALVRFCR